MNTIQDFIEQYYPNYDSCSLIGYLNDLIKISEGDLTGDAKVLYDRVLSDVSVFYSELSEEEKKQQTKS